LYCFTRQVKGAADYIPAEDRKSLPLRAANRGDDPLHREVERVAMAPDIVDDVRGGCDATTARSAPAASL
jgi:hypothetical protein